MIAPKTPKTTTNTSEEQVIFKNSSLSPSLSTATQSPNCVMDQWFPPSTIVISSSVNSYSSYLSADRQAPTRQSASRWPRAFGKLTATSTRGGTPGLTLVELLVPANFPALPPRFERMNRNAWFRANGSQVRLLGTYPQYGGSAGPTYPHIPTLGEFTKGIGSP
jgi:hypothetical protein